jgi:hypothetical protein
MEPKSSARPTGACGRPSLKPPAWREVGQRLGTGVEEVAASAWNDQGAWGGGGGKGLSLSLMVHQL